MPRRTAAGTRRAAPRPVTPPPAGRLRPRGRRPHLEPSAPPRRRGDPSLNIDTRRLRPHRERRHRLDPDSGFTGGKAGKTADAITGAEDGSVLRNYRFGMSAYKVPVANGTYKVALVMAEPYWKASGKRVFSATARVSPSSRTWTSTRSSATAMKPPAPRP